MGSQLVVAVAEAGCRGRATASNAVTGLASWESSSQDLEQAWSQVRRKYPAQSHIGFRVIVHGSPTVLRPGVNGEVYFIIREALSNAFRHANASDIEVELEYSAGHLRILVRDNGIGIDPQILSLAAEEHWGLSGMKERAASIGGRLRVLSHAEAGTEIELYVPGHVAFEFPSEGRPRRWFSRLVWAAN